MPVALECDSLGRGVDVDALAVALADAHVAAPPVQVPDYVSSLRARGARGLVQLTESGLASNEAMLAATGDQLTVFLDTWSEMLDARLLRGAVRMLEYGSPKKHYRSSAEGSNCGGMDVLHQLAGPLVNLLTADNTGGAARLLNAYLYRAPLGHEMEGLRLLPCFLALTALERAADNNKATDAAQRSSLVQLAHLALTPTPPRLVGLAGFSGTGKSTLARGLSPHVLPLPGAVIVSTDLERKRLFGVLPTDRLSKEHYSEAVTRQVYQLVLQQAERALQAGHSVVVDGVFAKSEERLALDGLAERLGIAFQGVWLQAPADLLIDRVDARTGDASDATAAIVEQQLSYQTGTIKWPRLNTSGSAREVLDKARELLALA